MTIRRMSANGKKSVRGAPASGGPRPLLRVGRRGVVDPATTTISPPRIYIKLTKEKGVHSLSHIGELVFGYLTMLRTKLAVPTGKNREKMRELYTEMQDLSQLRFRFAPVPEPVSAVEFAARNACLYPPEEILAAPYLYSAEFEPERLLYFLAHLRLDNLRLVQFYEGVTEGKTVLEEPNFGVKYTNPEPLEEGVRGAWAKVDQAMQELESLEKTSFDAESFDSVKFLEKFGISAELDLPQKNDFIPTDFGLKPDPAGVDRSAARVSGVSATADNLQEYARGGPGRPYRLFYQVGCLRVWW